jgi:hypothetical protein
VNKAHKLIKNEMQNSTIGSRCDAFLYWKERGIKRIKGEMLKSIKSLDACCDNTFLEGKE